MGGGGPTDGDNTKFVRPSSSSSSSPRGLARKQSRPLIKDGRIRRRKERTKVPLSQIIIICTEEEREGEECFFGLLKHRRRQRGVGEKRLGEHLSTKQEREWLTRLRLDYLTLAVFTHVRTYTQNVLITRGVPFAESLSKKPRASGSNRRRKSSSLPSVSGGSEWGLLSFVKQDG